MVVSVETLTRRADFLAAANSGFKFVKPSMVVQSRPRNPAEAPASLIRIGFTATKTLGGAVIRNRVKRRLRAGAQALVPTLGVAGHDYVFIGRKAAHQGTYDDLIRDMKHALKRLADQMASVTHPNP